LRRLAHGRIAPQSGTNTRVTDDCEGPGKPQAVAFGVSVGPLHRILAPAATRPRGVSKHGLVRPDQEIWSAVAEPKAQQWERCAQQGEDRGVSAQPLLGLAGDKFITAMDKSH
jgi:hypothetical protein